MTRPKGRTVGFWRHGAAGLLFLLALESVSAQARSTHSDRLADHLADYLGTWLIAKAQPAPWVEPSDPSTAPHDAKLVGKTISYRSDRIVAPRILACAKPHYAIKHVPPEGLFQGALTAPAAQAAALGFRETPIRTLETGCEGWFEFHFVDAETAMFALDNMIYTIRRQHSVGH